MLKREKGWPAGTEEASNIMAIKPVAALEGLI
jgi:hypothetical protein